MALLDKTSNLSPKTIKTGRGRSGDSKLLNQSTSIPKESPIGNPNSNKPPQSVVVEKNSPVGNPNSNKLSQSTLVERNSPVGNPNSNKLSQSVIVEKNSPLNNPISSKISQTQNAFFNIGKSNQFTRGGMVETFTGTRVFGSSGPPPPPPPPPFSFSLTLNSSSVVIGNDTVLSFTGSVVSSPSSSFELYFISGSNKYSATPNNSNFVGGIGSIVFSGIPIESETTYLVSSSVQVVDISQDLTVDFTASIQDTGESDPASTVGDSFATSLFDVVYSLNTYDSFVARTTTAGATQENLIQISSSFLPNIESQTL